MAQYRVGTVSVTSGSSEVSGSGTLWDSVEVAVGSLFNIKGTDGWYYIGNVTTNTALQLTAPYAGLTDPSATYVIVRDYLPSYSIPLMNTGDVNWPSIYNEAMLRIHNTLSTLSAGAGGAGGTGEGLDGAYDIENEITVDDAPMILYRPNTYENVTKAPAMHIIDQNSSNTALSAMPPFDGALHYVFSKHRVPIIAVTNDAERGDAGSPSSYAHAAIIGIANADEPNEFSGNYPVLQNVGLAGYAIDYHNVCGRSIRENIGVYGYSQRGYGIVARSEAEYGLYVSQPSAAPGAYISAEEALMVTNAGFTDGGNKYAVTFEGRRGGLTIESILSPSYNYATLKLIGDGVALGVDGQAAFIDTTRTSVAVSGGTIGYPAVDIYGVRRGLNIQSTLEYAIVADSTGYPSIKAKKGINLSVEPASITIPELGTLIYSPALSGLQIYTWGGWEEISGAEAGAGTDDSLQTAYDDGRTITVLSGGDYPVSATNSSFNSCTFCCKSLICFCISSRCIYKLKSLFL